MAAQPNSYDLHPQPTPHAKQDHTHRWRMTHEHLFDQRCVECNVPKSIADLYRLRALQRRVAALENGIRQIRATPPRAANSRIGGFGAIHKICDDLLPLSEMDSNDDR